MNRLALRNLPRIKDNFVHKVIEIYGLYSIVQGQKYKQFRFISVLFALAKMIVSAAVFYLLE